MRKWSNRSKRNMEGIHPDLIKVLNIALHRTPFDFVVTEGLRSVARQRELVAKGASKTMNSRHLTGHAFDIAVIDSHGITWEYGAYKACADVFKEVAEELSVDLEWGGDWKSFVDGPHFQLSWDSYNKSDFTSKATPPTPRTAMQSRTIQGVGAAGIGQAIQTGAAEVSALAADLPEDSGLVSTLKWVGLALTLAGIAYVIYARLDDRVAGHK